MEIQSTIKYVRGRVQWDEVELSQDPDEYREDDIDKEINCRDDGQNLVLHHMLTTPEMINDNK